MPGSIKIRMLILGWLPINKRNIKNLLEFIVRRLVNGMTVSKKCIAIDNGNHSPV